MATSSDMVEPKLPMRVTMYLNSWNDQIANLITLFCLNGHSSQISKLIVDSDLVLAPPLLLYRVSLQMDQMMSHKQ